MLIKNRENSLLNSIKPSDKVLILENDLMIKRRFYKFLISYGISPNVETNLFYKEDDFDTKYRMVEGCTTICNFYNVFVYNTFKNDYLSGDYTTIITSSMFVQTSMELLNYFIDSVIEMDEIPIKHFINNAYDTLFDALNDYYFDCDDKKKVKFAKLLDKVYFCECVRDVNYRIVVIDGSLTKIDLIKK